MELATRVEELARRVLDETQRQKALTQSANRETETGQAPAGATIATARRHPGDILAEWRAAEREAQLAEPDSVASLEARARADRLRDEYREAFDAAKGS